MVGREAEFGVLDDFVEANHAPRALLLSGEPGIGKTTIFRAAIGRAAAAGLRVFSARPSAGEMELPYVGLGDLLATVRTESLVALAAPQRAAIQAALSLEGSSSMLDEHALSRGMLELIRLEAADGDLLLAIDDVQWLDRPTASALTFALRRLGSTPIRVLVAVRRENGSPPEPPFGLAAWDSLRRIEVGPLSTTELGAVLRQRLGKQLSRPRLEALSRDSGGNPMFALELVQVPGDPAGSAGGLSSVVSERLRAVEPEARAALSFAAAALRPSTELLARAGVERKELRSALETGIIEADSGRLTFVHPLLRAAAYELLLPEERRETHARLARASTDSVERGHHVSSSALAPDESAAETLDLAAEEAAKLGDHAGAAAFLLRAAELSVDPAGEASTSRSVGAAKELELAGDVEGAATLARSMVDRLPPCSARAQARQIIVLCSSGSGMSYEEGLSELFLALEDASGDDGIRAELHVDITELMNGTCRLEEAVSHAKEAIELAGRAGVDTVVVAALAELGLAECMLGRGVTAAARSVYERWDFAFVAPSSYSPRMALGSELLYTTAFESAEELLEQELAMAVERGLEPVEVVARGLLAETQMRAGRWAEALSNARLAVEHARQAAPGQIVTGAGYALAMTKALLGQHEEARVVATAGLAEAEATQDFWFTTYYRGLLGLLALAEDDPQAAVDVLWPAWAEMLERGLGELSIFPVAQVLGEALAAVGRLDDALAVADALRVCPAGERPWCRAMASRLDALGASVRGDHVAARAAIAAALDAHSELAEPFEHARTLQIAGRVERSARNWGAARSAFVDALERFDQIGAARWSERAAADIARLPGRRPADRRELTPREREVAELVIAGLANKEIAARLFVSVSTVEKTLYRVYAKLGVRSRAELGGRLNRRADA